MAAAGLLCLAAPWIAAFYNQPVLTPLTRALSLTIVINSFGLIQDTILTKTINFKTQTKVSADRRRPVRHHRDYPGSPGFRCVEPGRPADIRSLLSTACLWFFSPWRPALVFSFTSLREMFGFGSRLLFSGVLNQIFDNIYLLVIGKLFSATDLGFFTRAKTLNDVPSQTLSEVAGRVTFPVFSTIQDDPRAVEKRIEKGLDHAGSGKFPHDDRPGDHRPSLWCWCC